MCWNYAVSASFALVETAVLLGVWLRDASLDRSNVLGFAPLVVQEALQALLWLTMPSCSAANRGLSMAVTITIHILPLALAQRSTLRGQNRPLGIARRAARRWFWVFSVGTCCAMFFELMPSCTIKGPHGHQIWPLLLIPGPLRYVLWLLYFLHLVAPVRFNPHHDLCDLLFNFVGGPTVLILWLYLGDEFGSAWCFFASALSLGMLLAPYPSVVKLCTPRDDPIIVDAWPAPPHAVHPPGVVVKVLEET